MMFLENKYKKWYDNIIEQSKARNLDGVYVEKHHIEPKCLGGSDEKYNIASLTAKEHYICHLLLTKMTSGYSKRKMLFAFGKFIQSNKHQQRVFSATQYQKIRESISQARKGIKRSKKERENISKGLMGNIPWNKGISIGPMSEEQKQNLSEYWMGKPKSPEHCANISKGKKGHKAGMTGKKHSEKTKQKMSENMKGVRGKQKRITCPICDQGSVSYRHVKFCKEKQ